MTEDGEVRVGKVQPVTRWLEAAYVGGVTLAFGASTLGWSTEPLMVGFHLVVMGLLSVPLIRRRVEVTTHRVRVVRYLSSQEIPLSEVAGFSVRVAFWARRTVGVDTLTGGWVESALQDSMLTKLGLIRRSFADLASAQLESYVSEARQRQEP